MNERGDFSAEVRLVGISAIAMTIGACCALAALVLLRLIDLFTNLFYFQRPEKRLEYRGFLKTVQVIHWKRLASVDG